MTTRTVLRVLKYLQPIGTLTISIVAIVISYQALVQPRGNVTKEIDDQAARWLLEIDRLNIEHPELRPFFYSNTPVPGIIRVEIESKQLRKRFWT